MITNRFGQIDAMTIYQARLALEVSLAELAAETATSEEIQQMFVALEKTHNAIEGDDERLSLRQLVDVEVLLERRDVEGGLGQLADLSGGECHRFSLSCGCGGGLGRAAREAPGMEEGGEAEREEEASPEPGRAGPDANR